MKPSGLNKLIILVLAWAVSAQVQAGSENSGIAHLPYQDIVTLSKKVEKFGAENGARVFLLARTGRAARELPAGVEYTHVAFAVYSRITTEDGKVIPGYAMYNLYQEQDNPTRSNLVMDYPVDFVSSAYVAKLGVIIPTMELQMRLLEVINSNTYQKLHNPVYSAIASPYDARYQNCTEFVLDVLNASIYRTDDIGQLKLNASRYFKAQEINVSPLKLFLGKMFAPDIKTSDHNGKLATATFETLARYLQENGLVLTVDHIEL